MLNNGQKEWKWCRLAGIFALGNTIFEWQLHGKQGATVCSNMMEDGAWRIPCPCYCYHVWGQGGFDSHHRTVALSLETVLERWKLLNLLPCSHLCCAPCCCNAVWSALCTKWIYNCKQAEIHVWKCFAWDQWWNEIFQTWWQLFWIPSLFLCVEVLVPVTLVTSNHISASFGNQ